MRASLARVSLLLLLSLTLTGCGVRFVYNQLDWLIPWYLDDYVELESDQKKQFETRLKDYLAWHRHDQLPQYSVFLNGIAAKAENGLTRADIAQIERQTELFAQAMMDRMLNDLMDLLASASDEQIDQLFARLERDNEEYRKEYVEVSADEQRAQRLKEVVQYVERWTGRLSDDQVNRIREWAKDFQLMGPDLDSARTAWQTEFRRVLAMRHNREEYEQAFRALIADPRFGRTQEFNEKLEKNGQLVVQLYLELDKTLTSKQRSRMVKKLRDYADDFLALSQQRD